MTDALRITIGIDPGLSGAIAVLADGAYRHCFDMPTQGRGKAGRQCVNAAALAAYLRGQMQTDRGAYVHAIIEDVSARPGQGVTSMFRFGQALGAIEGVLAALSIPVTRVTPQRWKAAFRLTGTEKDAARGIAQDLYPDAPLSRKRDCGRADALLVARHGWSEACA